MDPSDELLEEPLVLDGITVRRWSDLARLPRPREAASDGADRATHSEPDPETSMP